MRDSPGGSAGAGLLPQAARYARGELDAARAAAFEALLETNPAAQAALCQAVQGLMAERGLPARPDPAYRARVGQRLRRPRRHARRFVRAGAWAALAFFALGLGALPWLQPERGVRGSRVVVSQATPPELTESKGDLALACLWAELSELEGTHLARTQRDNQHRVREVASEAVPGEDFWTALNDGSHLARAHEELLRKRNDPGRKRDPSSRGGSQPLRKHL